MEAVILIGIQASGKSTFYKEKFFNTHLRISNDLLKTKNREELLLEYCKKTKMSFVIDNTNVTKEIRKKYINILNDIKIPIIGYYFRTNLEQSLQWNNKRIGKENIPSVGILGTYNQLEIPSIDEGFTELFYVDTVDNSFFIKEWKNEI
ncbi:MAG: AAA family ATPase [Treponema sp.]|nr:AAA family ATPase [Treponema sp.]